MPCETRCLLCNEVIVNVASVYTAAQLEDRVAAHHAVCPKRPLASGDYARATLCNGDWIEGTVETVRNHYGFAVMRPERAVASLHRYVTSGSFTFHANDSSIRRIPRPAEVQATVGFHPGERVVWRPSPGSPWAPLAIDGEVVSVRGNDRRVWTMRVLAVAGEVPNNLPPQIGTLLDLTAAPGKVERLSPCAPGCQCGAHGTPPPVELIDGLDHETCLARWMENRLAVEGGAAAPNAMTRMQRDVGRALWLERYGAQRAAELNAMVEADREAERNRVRIAPEVEPWE